MRIIVGILGLLILLIVLWEAFETVVLPRRVTRKFRLTRLFYRATWLPWSAVASRIRAEKRRETFLSFYGPLSLLFLIGVWAAGLIFGFALLDWAAGSAFLISQGTPNFWTDLYLSGTTFFTLGLGDIIPRSTAERILAVTESGMGFGFLALVIGYLPVIYTGFSKREVTISLLDARAGSPPTASELLRRHSHDHGMEALRQLLLDWEHWSAELLESHLSYPLLAYYRSQHSNQSWLAALTTILDTCVLVIVGLEGACERQAELTFAMARHAVVDLAQVFSTPPHPPKQDRLPAEELLRLRADLAEKGLHLRVGAAADAKLVELRQMYEPYVNALARRLLLTLPSWMPKERRSDNWQSSAWGKITRAIAEEPSSVVEDDHF